MCSRLVTNLRKQECHTDAHGYALCFDCLKIMHQIVKDLREYTDELETQITRQSKGAPTIGGSSDGEPPLAFDFEASRARDHIETVLSRWLAAYTKTEDHRFLQGLTTEQRINSMLAWFRRYYVHLGRSEEGPKILDDLDHALAKAQRACDRKQSKIWIGNCCGKPVVAFPKQKTMVNCEECGAEYDPAGSRRDMRVMGGQQLVTIKQAQSLGEVWERKINPNTVRSWFRRGKIHCQNENCGKGCEHRFRMSDLLALHKEN